MFFVFVRSNRDASPLKLSSDSPNPKCCSPAWMLVGDMGLGTTSQPSAPTSPGRTGLALPTLKSPIEMEVTIIIACLNIWFQGSLGA